MRQEIPHLPHLILYETEPPYAPNCRRSVHLDVAPQKPRYTSPPEAEAVKSFDFDPAENNNVVQGLNEADAHYIVDSGATASVSN